jgi:putative endonuclease
LTGAIWYLYLIRSARGTLYTGITTDVARRFRQHAGQGRGASRYLRGSGPLQLVYRVRIGNHALALRAEHRLRRLRKAEKESIVSTKLRTRALLRLLEL